MNESQTPRKAIYYVGCYTAFPFNDDFKKWMSLLSDAVNLEDPGAFIEGRAFVGETNRWKRRAPLSDKIILDWIREFGEGRYREVQFYTVREKPDWTRWLSEGTNVLMFTAPVVKTKANPVIINHFGRGGCLTVTYPVSRFRIGDGSPFQDRLVSLMKTQFDKLKPSWAFCHLGAQPVMPFSIGDDHVFNKTRHSFPYTSFDYDIRVYLINFYKEFAKGAFWTNFLNPLHVEQLGGIEAIRNAKPCSVIEELDGGGVMLQVDKSPLPTDFKIAAEKYQRLRSFLRPILLETGEDLGNLQRRMLGQSREEYLQTTEMARKDKELRKTLKSV